MSVDYRSTYDLWAQQLSVSALKKVFLDVGCSHVLVKVMGANNNSKQQIWLAHSLNDLATLPFEPPKARVGTSKKLPSASAIFHCSLDLSWIGPRGVFQAPQAKLVYYPQYPEVRLSGLLQSCTNSPAHLLRIDERGQEEGRVLLLGVDETKRQIFAVALGRDAGLVRELADMPLEQRGVLRIWMLKHESTSDPQETLLAELCEIAHHGWVQGRHLSRHGLSHYNAPNGGGYTLEALLGIVSNSRSAPDKHGYEIKQFNVGRLERPQAREISLMDSVPDGGEFVRLGPSEFIRKYGIRKSSADRFDFTGRHRVGFPPPRTGAVLQMSGFDGTTLDALGSIAIVSQDGTVLLEWSFEKLLHHWGRKHSQVVYVPSEYRTSLSTEGSIREYRYSTDVHLGIGTDFARFLNAVREGIIRYDPGMHAPNSSKEGDLKVRSLFRVSSNNLSALYDSFHRVNTCGS